jgi:acyl dehydratase
LSGDYNPIHVDPEVAERAGFGRPILHGLCTMGIAVRAAVDELADGVPERIRSVSVRFTKPVYPGETVRTEFHGVGNEVRFRARVLERDVVVLDCGTVTLDDSGRSTRLRCVTQRLDRLG